MWNTFDVYQWRSAMFESSSYFSKLFIDTTNFVKKFIEYRGGRRDVLLIEVGCGTGEALYPLLPHVKYAVGVDYNPKFIEFCKSTIPKEYKSNVTFLEGDAQHLSELINTLPEEWTKETTKIIICVGNTMGIIPESIKPKIYENMKNIAGQSGVFIVVYWNGNQFGHAVQHFYNKNPQLCGSFDGSCIDMSTCTLTCPSGYTTHWSTPEEVKQIMATMDVDIIELEENGNGVLTAARARVSSNLNT